jgi:hypothetical protein
MPIQVKHKIKVFTKDSEFTAHPEVVLQIERGFSIIGGGASTHYSEGQPENLLTACFPADNRTWVARSKDHVVSSPTVLTAFAIAIEDHGEFDINIWKRESPESQSPSIYVQVPDGYTMVGGGGEARTAGPGQLLTATYPRDSRTWEVASRDHTNISPGTIIAYAIGIKPRMEIEVISAMSGEESHPKATAQVSPGRTITCGGAFVHPHPSGIANMLVENHPEVSDKWFAQSKDHVVPAPTRITTYALSFKD